MKLEKVRIPPEELKKLESTLGVEFVTLVVTMDFEGGQNGSRGSLTASQRIRPLGSGPDGRPMTWSPEAAQAMEWKTLEKMIAGIKGKAYVLGFGKKQDLGMVFDHIERRYKVLVSRMFMGNSVESETFEIREPEEENPPMATQGQA